MNQFYKRLILLLLMLVQVSLSAQDYYFEAYKPFNSEIPSPEEFLGYPIGEYHTRHDLVVAYLYKLAELSDKASVTLYGRTHENRKLIILNIGSPEHIENLEGIRQNHLKVVEENSDVNNFDQLPLFINLAYGVHGNEPSSTEAALLTAYTLVASESAAVKDYLEQAIIFLDPTINPDGRDRHTNWVNNFRGDPLIADRFDIEHNETWPRGRTNHYWFDLNRDLILGVHPETNGRLKWYHDWYPNVVTDFHEMGTNSTYFFEPKNKSASLNPITPAENRDVLNKVFAAQYAADLDKIGSLYFTDEVYDSTYPGYGSTYMDLQGSLALLFEQASSRGHMQETPTGPISFSFTIRNQFVSSFATIKVAVENKSLLYNYQNKFFNESMKKAAASDLKGYVFGTPNDKNRSKAFIDMLLKHQIKVYPLKDDLNAGGKSFSAGSSYVVPTRQKQYYMVQSFFETYDKYRDSVFYDTSAWSLVNFYNMKYAGLNKLPALSEQVVAETNTISVAPVPLSDYAYIIPYDDYYAPALLYYLQDHGAVLKTSVKEFSARTGNDTREFNRGTLLLALGDQNELSKEALHDLIQKGQEIFKVQTYAVESGATIKGNGLGSGSFLTLEKPRAMMVVEGNVSSYEAGEVWHLFEERMNMPLTKVPERLFYRTDLDRYNVIIMVSGTYRLLNKKEKARLTSWISKGNTLITTSRGSDWAVKQKIVDETLLPAGNDTTSTGQRMNYDEARGSIGKQNLGGAIFGVDLDITHPIGFGYSSRDLPVYKNNRVWLAPSKNRFSTVARYRSSPHIDGYITRENLDIMKQSASVIVSKKGSGRVVLFADNPNFRGAWYGTNKLFMNAVFFGSLIKVPQ